MVDARTIRPSHESRLKLLSNNQCASEDCTNALVSVNTNLGKIAHIEAAEPGGPRFNPAMSVDARRHYNNLILLCGSCHDIVDNPENEHKYPVSLLKEWKAIHEAKGMESKSKSSSIWMEAISAIVESDVASDDENSETPDIFDIKEKVSYNNIVRNKPLIESYKVYYSRLNQVYQELESQGDFRKEKLMVSVNKKYLKLKGTIPESSEDFGDLILEELEESLMAQLQLSYNEGYSEDLEFAVSVILVDAFMRCRVLENPTS